MVTQTTRLTVTIRPELKAVADEVAKENRISRSKVVSRCLEELARSRKEKQMVGYYKAMATEHRDFAKKTVKVVQKIATSWGD